MNDNIRRPEEESTSEVRATARPRVEPMVDDISRQGFEAPDADNVRHPGLEDPITDDATRQDFEEPITPPPEPGPGSHDPTRFDHYADVPSRESESPLPVPLLATGMFIPVVIVGIVAIVLIFWFVF